MNKQDVQIRIFTFGQFTVERFSINGGWEEVPVREWNGYRSPQSLLGYLLCCHKRLATRASLLRDLGPFKGDPDKAISNAASLIRKISLPSLLQTLGGRHNNSYQLADQSIVWADCDACLALIRAIEQQRAATQEKQVLLEQAITLLQRGLFLEDEEGLWCYGERGMWEKKYYQCRLQLAEIYEQRLQFDSAERLYSALLAENMQDETALCRLMALLVQQGMPHLARKRYEEMKVYLSKDQLALSPTTKAFFEQLQNNAQLLDENGGSIPPRQKPIPTVLSTQPSLLGSPEQLQDIIRQIQEPGDQHMDTVRRQLLQTGMRAAEVAPLVPLLEYLDNNIIERFSQAIKGPSRLDEATLQYFAICTQQYWHCRQSAAFSARDLYHPVNHHFQKMIFQLERSLLPAERKRICTLLCQIAQLLGELALDMGSYEHGRTWHQASLLAAQEAEDAFLEVVAWGRISLTWIYSKIMPNALSCVQKARSLANK
ncbi:MAG TPA: bacterial transcriptional activator domain-containing protein, partial [Ktedonobacteraceae bacterium]|nr:bacterial transcriptional activator domain-containing protein [Ktedonobacteraceae bacterium]